MRLSTRDLPMFFAEAHGALAERLVAAAPAFAGIEDAADEPARDRAAARALAEAGLFELAVPTSGAPDTRALCLARELLGYAAVRADSIFAVQGLGTHPIVLAGSAAQRAELPAFARGDRIAAFPARAADRIPVSDPPGRQDDPAGVLAHHQAVYPEGGGTEGAFAAYAAPCLCDAFG